MSKREKEKRRHHRYDVKDVRANLMLPLEVRVLDMSLTGLRIESPIALSVGAKYNLTLRREYDVIQLQTDLQWCRLVRTEPDALGEAAPVYEVGLDYQEVLSQKARELLGFLQHNVVIELERREAFGYFCKAGEEPTEAPHQEFVVKQLSFSGVLIETEPMPEVDTAYSLEMHLDRLVLEVDGKVIHAERVPHPTLDSVCEAGIAFENLSPEAQQALEEMVAHFLE
ncbi:MAG: PilZ domain-containing protein [bacterium]|nr:PilZ domain-containing protein [bacterium]